MEICGEPFSDGGGKYAARREAFGIPHGLSRVSKEILQKLDLSKIPTTLFSTIKCSRRFCGHGFTIGEVSCPDEILQGGVVHQFPAQREIRLRLLERRPEIPAGENGIAAVGLFTSPPLSAAARRAFLRLAVGRELTPDLTALS